jgi:branched-chain amino acid transport system substrate-binding protein
MLAEQGGIMNLSSAGLWRRSVVRLPIMALVAAVLFCAWVGSSGASVQASKTITTIKYGEVPTPELAVNPKAPSAGNGGATAPGVTATSINIGEVVSLSEPAPGYFQDIATYAQAYAKYVNSLGGVYGRKLNITVEDDAADVTKGAAVCQNLVPKSFALVGVFAIGDAGCYPLVKSTGIPLISSNLFDPQLYSLPSVFAPQPDVYSSLQGIQNLALHKGTKITKVWLVEENQPGIAQQVAPEVAVWKSLGLQVLNVPLLPPNQPSYTSEIVQAKGDGAQVVDCFSCEAPLVAQLAQEMQQQGWNPPIKEGFAVYAPLFPKLAGDSAAAGWTVTTVTPVLNNETYLSTAGGKLQQKWVGSLPSTTPSPGEAVFGWENMDMFVQALVKAGPDLTRAKLVTALKGMKNFTSDGMIPPEPTKGHYSKDCYAIDEVTTTGGFKQVSPTNPAQLGCGGTWYAGS